MRNLKQQVDDAREFLDEALASGVAAAVAEAQAVLESATEHYDAASAAFREREKQVGVDARKAYRAAIKDARSARNSALRDAERQQRACRTGLD